jgi:hypothetical protein
MITTLSAMQLSRIKNAIIGVVAVLLVLGLQGCSAVRVAYNNGAQLSWWWLDGYMDFSREQAPQVKQALDGFFDWHRATQLPDYVALLAQAQGQVLEPTTPAAACRWQDQIRERLQPSLERALAQAADLLPGLGEPQFRHLEERYAKVMDEMRSDYLQPDPAKRMSESVKRAVDRAERLYGSLDAPQKRVIRDGVVASPYDPEAWAAERARRQKDTVQTLRRLLAERADRDTRVAALRTLVARVERSPDPAYRAYQIRLNDYNCAFAAQIHNATTPAQRKQARANIKDWEDDLRAVMAAP